MYQRKRIQSCFFEKNYQMPKTCCKKRLTRVIPIQQKNPMIIGFPPVLISLMILEFNPMPAIASTIKNLLHSFTGKKKDAGKPKFVTMVVKTEARRKNKIKKGKIFFRSNVLV